MTEKRAAVTENGIGRAADRSVDRTADRGTERAADQTEDQAADQAGERTVDTERILRQLARELELKPGQVRAAVRLMEEGGTIPFIARYRKEMTGELDELKLRAIEERLRYLKNLERRKFEVLRLIGEQGKLTEDLERAVLESEKLQEVEDLYRPYRQKRRTRAGIARGKGLEPLADWIVSQPKEADLEREAARYVDPEKGVSSVEEAVEGARDILAERFADDAAIRAWIRDFTWKQGVLRTEVKDRDKDEKSVYEMYYDFAEPVRRLPSHRILAINRGEREGVLSVRIEAPEERILDRMGRNWLRAGSAHPLREVVAAAIAEAWRRSISPSIEREIRVELTEKAEEQAIAVFSANLRNLLLQPPVRGMTVLGVDPAYRTGCKLAVVDETGRLLETAVAYPTPSARKTAEAEDMFTRLIDRHGVDLIAIGNGTASRETELFVAELIAKLNTCREPRRKLKYVVVSEAGASVYSASELAREEFPHLNAAERSAVSIARRLQDPLAELVKIDPKSIGVGQYQHDVSQKRLEDSLRFVVESAVNHVGVDLNTASQTLLSHVSGIGAGLARQIVKFREENGKFRSREQLKLVPRLGDKTFEQCAGFLRIPGGVNPLDNTPIHPESYGVVDRLFRLLGLSVEALGAASGDRTTGADGMSAGSVEPAAAGGWKRTLEELDMERAAEELGVGVPTLRDIRDSLLRPGRDPRDELPPPIFRTDVLKMEDLKPGMELRGTVRNVLDFGAFVDIGVKNDGLVHISRMSDRHVRHPLDVVSVGDTVTAWVLEVDGKRGRISLTMQKPT